MARVGRMCQTFLTDFKAFALRGNVLDLAIGIVIGSAFISVVHSLVNDVISPPLGLLLGGVDFARLTIKMKNFVYKDQPPVVIRYGKFIQTMISFTIMTMTLFFVVKGISKLNKVATIDESQRKQDERVHLEHREEVKVLCEIRDLLVKRS